MSDVLEIESKGAMEIVTLNRPDQLNAMSPELVDNLSAYFEALHQRPEVRVVILRANGRAFCAGLDLKGWSAPAGASLALSSHSTQKRIGDIYRRMRSCPQPIIACGQGAACGGGFSLMLAADVRLAAPDLRMNAAYIRIGLGGADMGSSYFLPRLVGRSLASELLLTGRFINAERALSTGLVSEIVPHDQLLETALALAEDMLLASPAGLRLTKQALELNTDAQSLEAAMAIEDRQQVLLSMTADAKEARTAFLEKRKPNYMGA